MKKAPFLIIVALLLTSCNDHVDSFPEPVPTKEATPTVVPTNTVTPSPTITLMSTPEPTDTPTPSPSPEPTSTSTPTPTCTSTPTPKPTATVAPYSGKVYETKYFSFTMPEIWKDADVELTENRLTVLWNNYCLMWIDINTWGSKDDGDQGTCVMWCSDSINGNYVEMWADRHFILMPILYPDSTPTEEKKRLLYLSTGGGVTVEEAYRIREECLKDSPENMNNLYYELLKKAGDTQYAFYRDIANKCLRIKREAF